MAFLHAFQAVSSMHCVPGLWKAGVVAIAERGTGAERDGEMNCNSDLYLKHMDGLQWSMYQLQY